MSDDLEPVRERENIAGETQSGVEKFRESEARFRILFERAPDAYYVSDLNGVLLDGNEAAEKLCGYAREELVGKSYLELDLLPPAEVPRAVKLLAKNALGRPTGPHECTLKRKDGRLVGIELHTIPVTLDGRKTVLGIARDITKRREAESALRKGEERYVRAATAGKVGVWEWELNTGEIYVDPNLKELLGYRDDELLNHIDEWGARVHPDDAEAVMQAADAHMRGETELYEIEHRMVHKNGSIRWFLARGSVIRDENGAPVRMVGSDVDITEQKLAEQERARLEADANAQRAQRLESLGMLAGGIAHDFNNLLTTILGHAGMTLAKLPADEPARELVEKIEEAAMAGSELTSQLLTYSGKGRVAVGPVDLNRIIEKTTALIGVSIPRNVRLEYELADSLPSIEADEAQLRQIVMNLVINASEAMDGGSGTITIGTGLDTDRPVEDFVEEPAAEGPFVYLDVRDTGDGMAPETKARIFDPFFTTKFTGRGLGLAAVRGIVRAHRGGIRLESAPGRGSAVRVVFPVVAVGAEETREKPASEASRVEEMHGRVLVVDDEPNIRDAVRHMLENIGLDVVTAANGTDAVNIIRAQRNTIQALVLDVTMPDLNGEETLERIRKLQPGVPAVFMSGYNERTGAWNDSAKPPVAFVQKPFRQQEIVARLHEVWPTGRD